MLYLIIQSTILKQVADMDSGTLALPFEDHIEILMGCFLLNANNISVAVDDFSTGMLSKKIPIIF